NPFRRDGAAAVIEAHVNHTAPRITDLNTETTSFLSELIAVLLAKRPADRFASAQVLHDVLEEAERSPWWTELAPKLRKKVAHLPKIRVRRETQLHGRDEDLQTLNAAWEKALGGEGNTVFVEGEAGIGKTRLVDAFLRSLDGKDIHVLYGSYPPSGGLGGISQAVLGKFGEAGLAEALAPYLTVTPSLVPAFAGVLKHESPPTGSEPLGGEALQAVCVHLMRALAEERALVWVLDDLHFAPRESRDVVLALARAVEGHRVLVVATARPGVPDEELANFSRLENFQRFKVARLGGREIIELLEDAFKSEALAEKLGVKITKKSDGVPFFIFEMIRGLREGQFIRQEPDGSYVQTQVIDEIEVPSAVKDLIEGRLRGLTENQRAVLDAGAVQGIEFDPALVAEVVEEKRVRVLRDLAEIERRHGLVHGDAGLTRFDQNQIQEVIYQDLTPDLRSEYHALLAEAYSERNEDEPSGEDAVFLASHHLRGSRPKDGLPHLTPALDFMEKSYRNEAAIELAARALDAPNLLEGKERAEVLLRKAGRHGLRGERENQRAALDEARTLADSSEDAALRAKVRVSLGSYLMTSDYAAGEEWLAQALDLAREAGDRKIEARAIGNLGIVFFRQGLYEQARAQHEQHLALAREIGDREGEATATGNLGNVFLFQGRYDDGRAQYEKWLTLAREIGDREGEAKATGNLGLVFASQGRFEEARAHCERVLALTREIGDREGEANTNLNLGAIFEREGRHEEACAQCEKSLTLWREIGDRRGEVIATGNLGGVFWGQGRREEARTQHEKYLALARELGDRRQEGYALASLASLADAEGGAEEALRLHGEALALRRELGEKGNIAQCLVAIGGIELKRDDQESAVAHLDEALALAREVKEPGTILMATVYRARLPGGDKDAALAALAEHQELAEHGAKMDARFRLWELTEDKAHLEEAHRLLCYALDHSPEEHRTSMIENVPLHRDIMQAWEEHGEKE
ncbi:MAG: ATP-binding protein, partial [Planctomycetota bacterium]